MELRMDRDASDASAFCTPAGTAALHHDEAALALVQEEIRPAQITHLAEAQAGVCHGREDRPQVGTRLPEQLTDLLRREAWLDVALRFVKLNPRQRVVREQVGTRCPF